MQPESVMSSPLELSANSTPLPWNERWLRGAVFQRLARLEQGCVTVVDVDGAREFGRVSADCSLRATVTIHDPNAYRLLALRGSIGVGEGYMAGDWSCDDLPSLVRIFVLNQDALLGLEHGLTRLMMPLFRLLYARRDNNHRGSRANIAAHYDLGNEFYRLFLDDTLMYSAAIFPTPDTDLREASVAKIDRICRKLELQPDDHLLEIGSGWGGFALYAAQRYGCRVTTTTISREQYELARARVREAGLEDRVTVLCQDYRDLRGAFDKLVSIEMIEAVGERHLKTYFRACAQLLKPHGMMLLQAITVADQKYEQYRNEVDFIRHYIFPGGFLPSLTAIADILGRATDLRIFHLEDIGAHYATTLRHWRELLLRGRLPRTGDWNRASPADQAVVPARAADAGAALTLKNHASEPYRLSNRLVRLRAGRGARLAVAGRTGHRCRHRPAPVPSGVATAGSDADRTERPAGIRRRFAADLDGSATVPVRAVPSRFGPVLDGSHVDAVRHDVQRRAGLAETAPGAGGVAGDGRGTAGLLRRGEAGRGIVR
ncbi:MAG: Cyclopropane-fatty-acyl-phospholipid synthase [Proteobacteria bacterium]|nr:Cyclopropane-fatty-acyl-phospholipid synthase [Pseudomonadota bacterium]